MFVYKTMKRSFGSSASFGAPLNGPFNVGHMLHAKSQKKSNKVEWPSRQWPSWTNCDWRCPWQRSCFGVFPDLFSRWDNLPVWLTCWHVLFTCISNFSQHLFTSTRLGSLTAGTTACIELLLATWAATVRSVASRASKRQLPLTRYRKICAPIVNTSISHKYTATGTQYTVADTPTDTDSPTNTDTRTRTRTRTRNRMRHQSSGWCRFRAKIMTCMPKTKATRQETLFSFVEFNSDTTTPVRDRNTT